jgi:protein OS-9
MPLLILFSLLKVIQEYVLGEYDNDATTAYHENSTSELADDDNRVKDISKRCCTNMS